MKPSPDFFDHRGRILIVDDEPHNRQLLDLILAAEGYSLVMAASGEEALAIVAQQAPDLILLDVMMPGMDGYQVAAAIKGNPATMNIPIVMITVLDDRAARQLGLVAGAEDFLTKPVDPAELCARVKNLLRLRAYGEHYGRYSEQLEEEVALRTAELAEQTRILEGQTTVLTEQAALLEARSHDLTQALARAEQANHTKDSLLMTVSHELRTPLNAILGWTDILERRPEASLLQLALPVIKRSALAQVRLVDDLLDVASIETGTMRLDTRPADLRLSALNAVEVVRPAAEAKRVSIVQSGDATPAIVLGDPVRLQQIMWNLLSNAVKFTPDGGRVHVRIYTAHERVCLEVSDSGIGIEAGFLARVFEQFFQADISTTRRYNGLGLGLTLVQKLVEMHGGVVKALSPGTSQGATFVVELPVYHGSIGEVSDVATPVELPAPGVIDLSGVRVLIVDDEPDSRETVAMILEAAGASTVVAESASRGLAHLLEHDIDVVVSDIVMPVRDGIAFIQDVRALLDEVKRQVPAVALTAMAREEERQWILGAGFQKYVAKPVAPDHLVRCVAAAAGGAGGRAVNPGRAGHEAVH